PDLIEAAAGEPDPEVQAAINLLSAWDGVFDADADAALLFEEFMTPFATVPFAFPYSEQAKYDVPWSFDAPLSTPSGIKDKSAALNMLKTAITTTKEKYGAIDRPYGDVSRFVIGDKNLAGLGSFGNLGAFNVITWTEINDDGIRTPRHGETWISMVEFSDPIKAVGLMTYGNSRQDGTPHYSDQLHMLAEGRFRTLWLTREEVEANTARRVELEP
ncbi:MAG: penicillin acylase family protein, partial [Pseudomonadota bacterium]